MKKQFASIAISAAISLLAACNGGSTSENDPSCAGGKCDDPGSAADRECRAECGGDSDCVRECRDARALNHCELRRADAIESSQRTFTKDNIRWACADVEGVTEEDRGQEYCEYYAVIQAPPDEDGKLPPVVTTGRNFDGGGATDPGVELSRDQKDALEDEPDAVVGQCIFTAWHQDIRTPLPVCTNESECATLSLADNAEVPSWGSSDLGIPLSAEFMKMKVTINSNNAAADLFEKCLTQPTAGDPENPEDPLHDDYIRGCMKSYELFKTEWRRSDPSVCAAGVRVAECGCGVDSDGDGVADITDPVQVSRAIVPFQPDAEGNLRLRGFHLGTWSDVNDLPAGCRYVETGDADSTSTLVACDITANDLITNAADPKGLCRQRYGNNVVVHVPVPAGAIVCSPPEDGQYSASCGELPWVVGAEGPAVAVEECDNDEDDDGDGATDCDDSDCANADVCAPPACELNPCETGPVPGEACEQDACKVAVCEADPWCCSNAWDHWCVGAVAEQCGIECPSDSE